MKLCSTCARGRTRAQTTWEGASTNRPTLARYQAKFAMASCFSGRVLRTPRIDFAREARIGGIKIEHPRDHRGVFVEALAFWTKRVLRSSRKIGHRIAFAQPSRPQCFLRRSREEIVTKVFGLTWCVRCPVTAVSWTPDYPWHATR